MALTPIQMFQNSQSSLAQILQGGNQTLTGILDKAVQIGRDMTNNQLAQERDMLGMRAQETALFQRRAENLQQNNEDMQNFARRAFESDRRYGLEERQMSSTEQARLAAQSNDNARLGLAERGMAVTEGSFDLRKQEEERKMNFSSGLLGNAAAEPTPEKEQSFGGKLANWFTGGAFKSEPKVDEGALRGELDVVTAQAAAAKEIGDADTYKNLLRRRGELVGQLTEAGKTGTGDRVPGSLTEGQKLNYIAKEKAAAEKAKVNELKTEREALNIGSADSVAFPSSFEKESKRKDVGKLDIEAAKARDEQKQERLLQDVMENTKEQFIALVPGLSKQDQQNRSDWYDRAQAYLKKSGLGNPAAGKVAEAGIK